MGIRMSGLSSGLDTEAIIGALMSAQSMKKTKIERSKTKLEWKQTKWAELNTKLLKLYKEQVSKMQLQASYMTKKTSVSDPDKVSVTANSKVANGNYTLQIEHIATSQYLTGAMIDAKDSTAKLVDIDPSLLNKEITVTNGDKTKKIEITEDMKISDFTKALRAVGLNADFDADQKRIFISSKESGLKNAFSITSSGLSADEISGRENLRNAVGYDKMSAANKTIVDEAMEKLQTSGVDTKAYKEGLDAIAKAAYETRNETAKADATTYVKAKLYDENYDSYKTKAEESLKSNYYNEDGTVKEKLANKYGDNFDILTQQEKEDMGVQDMSKEEYIEWAAKKDMDAEVAKKADADTTSFVNNKISSDNDVKLEIDAAAFAGKTTADIEALGETGKNKYYTSGVQGFAGTDSYTEDSVKTDIETMVRDYASVADRNEALSGSALAGLGLADVTVAADGKVSVNGGANDSSNASIPAGMALMAASDSKVILNGAELTSSSSTVSANGLSISLTGTTKSGESITFSVSNDVDGVYNSIKSFLTEYNEVMKEMNSLYNAEAAKGYEPLTSEQKKAMSDDDVKLWEDKIKNSLLRNDSTLSGIISGMRTAMMSQVEYDGKKYSLASFGIMTSTVYTEGGLYHIYGDKDDATYADRDDKLRKALEQDPDAVVNVLSDIFGKLRETMNNKMAATKQSSTQTFYNDIKMKDDLKGYEKQISTWEDKLASMEEAYYKKFTAMEMAMSRLQSQQSSLAGLLGG